MQYHHQPVMLKEVLEILDPREGQYFLDATLGGAGYTQAIASRIGEKGKILALDLDPWAVKNAEEIIREKDLKNIKIANSNFSELKKAAQEEFGPDIKFHGMVFDLGLSLAQLEDKSRGFSFKGDTLLDMSFAGEDKKGEVSRVGRILNKYEVSELEKIFKEFGEERLSLRIARNIEKHRQESPIRTTGDLEKIIEEAIPGRFTPYKDNIKARIFQALRIKVNQELDNLKQALPQALELLKPEGRIVVISYHSLEDRIVKDFFQQESRDCICPPELPECRCGHKAKLEIIKHSKDRGKTKKFLVPTREEIEKNPKARSAKLRAVKKLRS